MKPQSAIESSIASPNLRSLPYDYAEVGLDSLMSDGVLKDLPGIGTVVGVISFTSSLSKARFAKKLCSFLHGIKDTDPNKRVKLLEKIRSSSKYQRKVGDTILEIVDRVDSDRKPEIIGNLFAATISGYISYDTFLRSVFIVEQQFIYDLIDLKNYIEDENIKRMTASNSLLTSGLLGYSFLPSLDGTQKDDENCLEGVTELGDVVLRYGMKAKMPNK